jgi:hypothetical protein
LGWNNKLNQFPTEHFKFIFLQKIKIKRIYLKKGLSREGVKILAEENSISSTVNITKDKVIWNNKYTDINIFTNALFYKLDCYLSNY